MELSDKDTADATKTVDVVIVGYGPTGQLLSMFLGRQGHKVTVVERWPDLYPLPRAVHFDHEIARMFQAVDAIEDINKIVETADAYEWRNADKELLLEFSVGGKAISGWPVAHMFSQPILERVLDEKVKALPTVTVRQGWSATAFTQDADGVQLDIEHGSMQGGQWVGDGQRENIRAKYIVGADGANSFVRRSLGIPMHDIGFAEFNWLVVDVIPKTERVWSPRNWQWCNPSRPTSVISGGPGRRRWEFMLLPGEKIEEMNRDEVAWELLAQWDVTPENATLERHAVYTFRGQWATSWRQGRAFLAGDAAHLTAPFTGQGMCAGMRDATALAWRLDAVLRGKLSDAVLDSYGPERSAHAQELIRFAIELGKVICITDPQAAAERDRMMLAARAEAGYKAPSLPQPRLGDGGLYLKEAPGSGLLGPQGVIEVDGKRGLFDDLLGVHFTLIAKDAFVLEGLSNANRAGLKALDAVVVHLGDGSGSVKDVEGTYTRFLDGLGCVAMLARPDFYLQGGARNIAELNQLLDATREALAIRTTEAV